MGSPIRTCVGCHKKQDKASLIRVVRTPGGDVLPDQAHKLQGRGVYLCPSIRCVEKAEKGMRIEQHLKTEISKEIYEKLIQWCRT